MNILKVSLRNYRNFHREDIEPDSGINIIYGNNAQGKTNLLEAIWLFTGGRSFRGAKDSELLTFGENNSDVYMDFFSQGRKQSAKISISNKKRTATLNGVEKSSLSAIVGKFCAVVFSPVHLSLIKDGPSERRRFIDAAICQIKPTYCSIISKYNHIIDQRNTLLKDVRKYPDLIDTLEIWDQKLSQYGVLILDERIKYCELLKEKAKNIYNGISNEKEDFSVFYKSSLIKTCDLDINQLQDIFLKTLKEHRQDDLFLGYTSLGPHRDDLSFNIDGKSAKSFASQGQQRSGVLSLKLAEAAILEKKTGEKPVILLDDVMSELDNKRQKYLLDSVEKFQVFITCCDPSNIVIMEDYKKFEIKNGTISFI